jgi:hypothetical protein
MIHGRYAPVLFETVHEIKDVAPVIVPKISVTHREPRA